MPCALVVLHVGEMGSKGDASDIIEAFAGEPGVLRAFLDPEAKLISILAQRDSGLDLNHATQVLRDAGYSPRPASAEEYARAEAAVRNLGLIDLAAATFPVEADGALHGATELITLAHSVQSLRDHFNAHADRLRFVAILSPT
jgi:hypothetical protein